MAKETAMATAMAMATVATTVVTTTATTAETYWKEFVGLDGKVSKFELTINKDKEGMTGENWISPDCDQMLWSKEDDKKLVLPYNGRRHFDSRSRIRV